VHSDVHASKMTFSKTRDQYLLDTMETEQKSTIPKCDCCGKNHNNIIQVCNQFHGRVYLHRDESMCTQECLSFICQDCYDEFLDEYERCLSIAKLVNK
jgi:hypothetical protein